MMFSWHRHTHTQSLAKNCRHRQKGPMPKQYTQSLVKNCCHSQKGPMQSYLIAHHNRTSTNDCDNPQEKDTCQRLSPFTSKPTSTNDCHNPQEKDTCQRLSPFTTKPTSTNDCHNPQEKDTCQRLSPITTKLSLTLVAIHQKRTTWKDWPQQRDLGQRSSPTTDRHQSPQSLSQHRSLHRSPFPTENLRQRGPWQA